MEKLTLNIEKRDKKVGLKTLRDSGKVPAVFYGRKEKSTPVVVAERDFQKVWKEAGESTIISLHGGGKDIDAIIHEVQVHPVSGMPLHADFYVIEKDRKITVPVPLEFVGESEAEKQGLILVKVLHELEVESLPGSLPQHLEVDISVLKDVDSHILVKDIKLPEGVKATAPGEEVVISVNEAREEEPEEVPEEVDMDSIEVETKGKGEEGAEGEDGAKAPEAPAEGKKEG